MSYDEYKSERRSGIKWAIWGVLILFVFGLGMHFLGFLGTVATTPTRIISKTLDADNVIANYEWFKRQYQDVQAQDRKISGASQTLEAFLASAGPRSDWHFEDRQEFSRLSSVKLGLENQRASMVAEYNARTQMMNRNLFRTSDLPAVIQ